MKMAMQTILVVWSHLMVARKAPLVEGEPSPEEQKLSLVEQAPPLEKQQPDSVFPLRHVPTQFVGVRSRVQREMFG